MAALVAFGGTDLDVVDDATMHELDSPSVVVVAPVADDTHSESASITVTIPSLDVNGSRVMATDAFHDPFPAPSVVGTIDESSDHWSIDTIPGTKITSFSPHVALQTDWVLLAYFPPLVSYEFVHWKLVGSVELVDVDCEHVVHV